MEVGLKKEFDYYRANQDEFVEKYDSRVIALKGETFLGVYDTEFEALEALWRIHEPGTVFVQRVSEGEEAYTITIATPGVSFP